MRTPKPRSRRGATGTGAHAHSSRRCELGLAVGKSRGHRALRTRGPGLGRRDWAHRWVVRSQAGAIRRAAQSADRNLEGPWARRRCHGTNRKLALTMGPTGSERGPDVAVDVAGGCGLICGSRHTTCSCCTTGVGRWVVVGGGAAVIVGAPRGWTSSGAATIPQRSSAAPGAAGRWLAPQGRRRRRRGGIPLRPDRSRPGEALTFVGAHKVLGVPAHPLSLGLSAGRAGGSGDCSAATAVRGGAGACFEGQLRSRCALV